jgi:hypothetical protein
MSEDSYIKCSVCGRESKTNFAGSMATGWPTCCGYTMTLVRTDADIDAAMAKVVSDQTGRHA